MTVQDIETGFGTVAELPAATPGRRRRSELRASALLGAAVVTAIAVVILYPILRTAWDSFVPNGHLTAEPFRKLFALSGIGDAIANTAVYVAGTTVLTVVIATFFAWANERTDARVGWAAGMLPIVPLLMPVIGGVIGQVFLFSAHSGYANVALRSITGSDSTTGPVDIYGFPGLIAVTSVYFVPFVYIVLAAALRRIDPAVDEAARVSGAGPLRVMRTVTLPAIAPALAGSALMVMVLCIANFSVPIVIGSGAGIDTLSTLTYRLFTTYPPQTSAGIGLGAVLLVAVQLVVLVQGRVNRKAAASAMSARGSRATTAVTLGAWRWVVRALMLLYFLLAVVLPVLALALVSLQGFWGPKIVWSKLTLANYRTVLSSSSITKALTNSLMLGAVGATIGVVLAVSLSFYAVRRSARVARLVNGVMQTPATIPYTVLGISFLIAFTGGPINLYGTRVLLLLTYVVMFLPQAAGAVAGVTAQVDGDVAEASRVAGAGPIRTFRRVVLPQLAPTMLAGWIILFILMSTEVTASALISGVGNPVVGPLIVDFYENGTFPQLAAVAILMTIIDAVIVLSLMRVVRRSFSGAAS